MLRRSFRVVIVQVYTYTWRELTVETILFRRERESGREKDGLGVQERREREGEEASVCTSKN